MLDALLESWARWVHAGSLFHQGTSIIGLMMDNRGLMGSGNKNSGRALLGIDTKEAQIEALLMHLSNAKPECVEALRLEYGGIWIKRLPNPAKQADKAHALGISLRTYRYRIAETKTYLRKNLGI